MSRYIEDIFIAEFDRQIKREWAAMANLRHTVRVADNVIGETKRFNKSLQGVASKAIPRTAVVPMNIDFEYVTATLEDWEAGEYTSIFEQKKVNVDEKSELVGLSAAAIARREDQIIIDALEAGATTLTVAKTIGDTEGMNSDKFKDAKRQMDYYSVPADGRTFIMSSEALSDMLGETVITSVDYNSIRALYAGEVDHWLGFTVKNFGYMEEGGLPKATNTRSAFAYHKQSLGLAIGMNKRTLIDWVAPMKSHLVNTLYSAGAIAIDAKGMVTISHDEAA